MPRIEEWQAAIANIGWKLTWVLCQFLSTNIAPATKSKTHSIRKIMKIMKIYVFAFHVFLGVKLDIQLSKSWNMSKKV